MNNLQQLCGVKSTYTTPSTVKEVSAIFVETINRLQFGGGGLKTRTCPSTENSKRRNTQYIIVMREQMHIEFTRAIIMQLAGLSLVNHLKWLKKKEEKNTHLKFYQEDDHSNEICSLRKFNSTTHSTYVV